MFRPPLEVADIFRDHGPAWRDANRGHLSLGQLKVMSAIERCRTAALGGHVARCTNADCGHTLIAYNSCRNRHCPKCQGSTAREWLEAREAELLPVPYFHVVYTLPSQLRDVAWQNKRVVYGLLMKAAAETTLQIAADPKRLGARVGITSVLHTWGSAMTHHPHVHMIVPGGGISLDGSRWISASEDFLLPVPVLARMFRGKMLSLLKAAIAHRGTVLLDVLSPCVTFNDHDGSTKSYSYVKDHEEPLQEISFIPLFQDITVDYPPGTTHNIERVFGLLLPEPQPVTLAPAEHTGFEWLPWREAAEKCVSWSNRDAILKLPDRALARQ